jgi:hypothetical protein
MATSQPTRRTALDFDRRRYQAITSVIVAALNALGGVGPTLVGRELAANIDERSDRNHRNPVRRAIPDSDG